MFAAAAGVYFTFMLHYLDLRRNYFKLAPLLMSHDVHSTAAFRAYALLFRYGVHYTLYR